MPFNKEITRFREGLTLIDQEKLRRGQLTEEVASRIGPAGCKLQTPVLRDGYRLTAKVSRKVSGDLVFTVCKHGWLEIDFINLINVCA